MKMARSLQNKIKSSKPKLLAPVGNWPMLVAAISAGADAVYFGVKQLNMRATAQNFEEEELTSVVNYCHERKVLAYLTINTIIYENERGQVGSLVNLAKKAKVDAIICWDFAVINACKKHKIPFHISTQASVSNSESAKFYSELGASMIVLARECTLEQISEIKKKVDVPIEVFVHGAMCVSESGRCFTSQFLFGRSANRGDCLQPCRREYTITDEEGKQLKLSNNFVMSAKDLCAMPFIDKLIESGVSTFKIEGRNKSPEYVKTVVACYREAIDAYYLGKLDKKLKDSLMVRLDLVFHRGFSDGFFMGVPVNKFTDSYGPKSKNRKEYVGLVRNYYKKVGVAEIYVESNPIKVGDSVIIIGNATGCVEGKVLSLEVNKKKVKSAGKGASVAMLLDKKDVLRINDKVYVVVDV